MRKARRAARCAALPRSIHTLSFRASDRCHWRGNPFPAPAGAESLAFLCEAAQCSPRSKYPWGAHRVVRSEAKLRWREAPEGETGGAEPRPYAPSIDIPCVIYVSGRCGHRPLRKTAVLPLHPREGEKGRKGGAMRRPSCLFWGRVWEKFTRWYSYRNSPGCRRWACPCRRCRWSGRTANRSGR